MVVPILESHVYHLNYADQTDLCGAAPVTDDDTVGSPEVAYSSHWDSHKYCSGNLHLVYHNIYLNVHSSCIVKHGNESVSLKFYDCSLTPG